jgi:N-acetylmuramoyl-L-alanine amidase
MTDNHRATTARQRQRRDRLARTIATLVVFAGIVVGAAAAGGAFSSSSSAQPAQSLAPSTVISQGSSPRPSPVARHRRRHRRTAHPSRSITATATPTATAAGASPFAGVTVGVDPGHNGGNFTHTAYINQLIWNGREHEACNTTGTETDAGYTEAQYNFNVANYLAADLRAAGANVVMTRTNNTGYGPCVNKRAEIINASKAAVAIDIHADGGPASGRGFTVLEPVTDSVNMNVIATSRMYGSMLRNAFEQTGMPTSTYDGTDGINYRDDLAGLNLTTVPQVLIETGNMRNATDAALLTSTSFQHKAATAIMAGMATFLESEHK